MEDNFITTEHLEFLDELRLSGKTNMFDAVRFLRKEFPALTEFEARKVLVYWMKTFTQRHQRRA
jgi:hypothetical protein